MENLNLFQLPLRGLVVGSTGQGKTTLLFNLLTNPDYLHKKFHKVHLFSVNIDYDPKYKKMNLNPKRMYNDYDTEELERIFNEKKPDGKHELIILDDCISEQEFKSESPKSILNKIMVLGRLRGLSLLISVQKCRSCSTIVRSNINWLITFPTIYDLEIKATYDISAINSYQYFKKMFHQITKDDQHHAFLYDRRQNSLMNQIYQLRPEKGEKEDEYTYRVFKYSYNFEY